MIRKYIEKIGSNRNPEDMKKLADMLADLVCMLKDSHPDIYNKYKIDLYELAYGKVLNEDMADEWVSKMNPKAKWSREEVKDVISDYDTKIPLNSIFVIMNMLYSDMHYSVGEDVKTYVQATNDWYYDEDSTNTEEAKLYNYYKYIVK
jgi:hypothetical protein